MISLQEKYNFKELYGIDISSAMIEIAKGRTSADVGDVLGLDPQLVKWDLAYSGFNVFQYID